ncbi:ABC transporter permease [Streptococcus jiangjianxini]|uniref:ABC transporter permease n=1 Tax=Streptococcus jiangjianxini TaxID=3161189 RepID=UPI0032EAB128
MRKINNRKWISNISRKSMQANNKRNLILIVAIALTTFMMTAVFTITGSLITGMEKSTMHQVGTDLHAGFKYLTQEQFDKLSKDNKISELCHNIIVGQSTNEELREDYTEIRYTDEVNAKHSFSFPEIGNLPQEENELATCTNVLDDFGLPHEIGQKIHLKLDNGTNTYEGDFVVSGIWTKPAETLANQIFVSKEFQKKFSPVWKNEADKKKFLNVNSYAGSINPGFNFGSSFNISGKMDDLKMRLDFGEEINEGVNWAYSASLIDPTSIAIMILLLSIVIISGYLIISNIFNISVTAEIQHYGLLKTIGTTNRQLKKIIIKQAILISTIAIPVGIVSGYLASMVIIPLIVSNLISVPVNMEFNIWFFVISGIFSWITVRISCVKPCKIVKKISPVEAVTYIDYSSSIKKKTKKVYKVTPVMMAWQNIGRNKKKTFYVILSMALSVIMLNITMSLVASFDEDKYISSFSRSDFTVADASVFNKHSLVADYEGVNQDDIEYCRKLKGVETIGAIYMSLGVHKVDDAAFKKVKNFYESIKNKMNPNEANEYASSILDKQEVYSIVYGLDQMVYENLEMDAGKIDWNKFETGKYVVISSPIEGSKDDAASAFYKISENIDVKMPDGSVKSYEVMGIGKVPHSMGPGFSHTIDISIMLPSAEYLSFSNSKNAMKLFMDVDDEYVDATEASLTEYSEKTKPLLDFESRNKYKESFNDMKRTFLLIGSAMSLILALIGTLNFVNLTYTSIIERRGELKTLHAVGMTYKQIKNMLIAEGIIRIMLTFVVVFTIGIGLNHVIVNMIAGQMIMFKYHFVAWPMMLSAPLFLLIAFIVPKLFSWQNKT